MNRYLLLFIMILLSCKNKPVCNYNQKNNTPFVSSINYCEKFDSLNTKIRDGLILKKNALNEFQKLIPQIKTYYYEHNGKDFKRSSWVFPIVNYNSKAIGGKDGIGYVEKGYDFFDGNKHLGHPALDIFINDKNEDGFDDKANGPVNVLSVTEGIVVAIAMEWNIKSSLRGGKYIYIYQPSTNSLFYYAHNDKVLVHLCEIVKPGDIIATVGRTGFNAFKKRSPTHLHFMWLKFDSAYYPKPINAYRNLLGVQTK